MCQNLDYHYFGTTMSIIPNKSTLKVSSTEESENEVQTKIIQLSQDERNETHREIYTQNVETVSKQTTIISEDFIRKLVERAHDVQNKYLAARDPKGINEDSYEDFSKQTRHRFKLDDKKLILDIYDQFQYKRAAMDVIHSFPGFEKVDYGSVCRWKSSMRNPKIRKTMGRPISTEFESLVVDECLKGTSELNSSSKRDLGGCSYKYIRECADRVRERLFQDVNTEEMIAKWKHDQLTKDLLFTNKWIKGFLRRNQIKSQNQLQHKDPEESDDSDEDSRDATESLNSHKRSENSLLTQEKNKNKENYTKSLPPTKRMKRRDSISSTSPSVVIDV